MQQLATGTVEIVCVDKIFCVSAFMTVTKTVKLAEKQIYINYYNFKVAVGCYVSPEVCDGHFK